MIKIILCALNEAKNLEILLPKIAQELVRLDQKFEIILCIDGTNDDSQRVILEQKKIYPIRILQPQNAMGLGIAYKRIFLDLIKNCQNDDLIISMDADNTHLCEQFSEILDYFQRNQKTEILVLSRFCAGSRIKNFPLFRIFISKSVSILMQIIFAIKKVNGKNLRDYSSGYRAYKAEALKSLYTKFGDDFITQKNFTYTCELLINFKKNDAKLDEIGIFYDYGKKIGASKLNFFSNGKSFFGIIFKELF